MSIIIRNGRIEDASHFVKIKERLSFSNSVQNTGRSGGFLLGCDEETYANYIRYGDSLVCLKNDKMIGFGILFPDEILRQSDLWRQRSGAQWEVDPTPYESLKLSYVEQLAFLPGNRYYSSMVAMLLADRAFKNQCEALVATTVIHPVKNVSALPYILAAGGFGAGTINELYPNIGEIRSRIYVILYNNFIRAIDTIPAAKRMLDRAYGYLHIFTE